MRLHAHMYGVRLWKAEVLRERERERERESACIFRSWVRCSGQSLAPLTVWQSVHIWAATTRGAIKAQNKCRSCRRALVTCSDTAWSLCNINVLIWVLVSVARMFYNFTTSLRGQDKLQMVKHTLYSLLTLNTADCNVTKRWEDEAAVANQSEIATLSGSFFFFWNTPPLCHFRVGLYSWEVWLSSSAWAIISGLYSHFTFHWTFNGVRISLSDGRPAVPGSRVLLRCLSSQI